MSCRRVASKSLHYLRIGLTSIALFQFSLGAPLAGAAPQPDHHDHDSRTPIKHVIVIIGENRTFDHVFATYKPKDGEKVWNLLSEGIINADGTPGPQFSQSGAARRRGPGPRRLPAEPGQGAVPE